MAPVTNEQKALVAQLLSTDAELRALARLFVKTGLEEQLKILQYGSAADKLPIIRSMSSIVTNALMERTDDDEGGSLRAEFQRMMEEVREDVMERVDQAAASQPPPSIKPKAPRA